MISVVVTGGRHFRNLLTVEATLDAVHRERGIRRLSHGDATGADSLAARWRKRKGIDGEKYDADWTQYGLAAGPIRNSEMLAAEKPDLVVAFRGNRGTADCVRKAREMGIEVLEVE